MHHRSKLLNRWSNVKIGWKILILIVILLYVAFAVSRYGTYTAYSPFARRVFYIDPEKVSEIRLLSGTYGEGKFYTTPEEIEQAVDVLNNYRYIIGVPAMPFATGGYEYYVIIVGTDGITKSYEVSSRHVRINGVYMLGSTRGIISLYEPVAE